MFIDEAAINLRRRSIYIERIRKSVEKIGVIDGCNAMELAEELVGSFEFALRHHLAEWSRVELRPQIGIGTRDWLRIRGRVGEKSNVKMPKPAEEPFDILISCWYRFLVWGMPPTPIRARRGDHEVLTATDEEGFFDIVMSAQPSLGDAQGIQVELELGDQATVRAEKEICRVLTPNPDAEIAVLVDLDGVLLEYPNNRFTLVLSELILAQSRGVIAPLQGLDRLLNRFDKSGSPVFYISNSPRHLYNHIRSAMKYANLPVGHLQLRDYDLRLRESTTEDTEVIEMILAHEVVEHYPEYPFIFVGTRRRAHHYKSVLQTLRHRLQGAYLFSGPDVREMDEVDSDLHIVVAAADELLGDAIAHGWAVS